MARKISVQIVGNSASLERSFARSKVSAEGFGASMGRLSVGFGQLLKGVVVIDLVEKALEGLSEAAHLGIEGFANTTRVAAQTAAVIKSTGGAANVSAKQVHELAASLSNISGIDDEVIQAGENVLLSFKQIRDFAGKNNDVFTQATKVVTDYASRTGKSATTSATIIGRALADPATKAVALSRAGIVLTKSQLDALKAIEKTSGVVAAQKVLLQDLRDRYQGAAAAAGQTLPGQLNILKERFKDLAGELVGDVVPAFSSTISGLTGLVVRITEATTFRAKLNILWTGAENAAKGAQSAIGAAIGKVDWKSVWANANGIADGLTARLKAVNWSSVGSAIGDGIAKSVSVAASATKSIAGKLENIFNAIDWIKLGQSAGPGLAAALVTAFATLTDPSFWIKHWDLALAVGSVAFGDGLGRIAGKLAKPFAELGARLFEDLAVSVSGAVERLGGAIAKDSGPLISAGGRLVERFGATILTGFLKLPGVIAHALSPITSVVSRVFGRLGAITRFTVKVLGVQAVIDTVTHAFAQLGKAIGGSLDDAWTALERSALKAAIAIISPFASLPLGLGSWAQKAKAALELQLDGMVKDAQKAGAQIAAAVGAPAGPAGPNGAAATPGPRAPSPIGSRNASAGFGSDGLPPPPVPRAGGGLTAAQKNTFFDNAISSDLTRAGFITSVKQQIAALQTIAGLISQRIAKTKDVTRRRTLEDQLLSVQSQITGDRQQVASDFLASLQFAVTKAQATATFKDDIDKLTILENGIKAEIKASGTTLDLQQQLFDVRGQLAAARNSQRNAAQFKKLGLTAAGEDVTPGVKSLQAELNKVSAGIKGTFLDTTKTESIISGIRKVLSGSLGAVGQEVRSKVQGILDDLNNQLKNNVGNLTKFSHVASAALIAGLGLSPDQEKAVRGRIAQLGPNGTLPARGPAFALAGASAGVSPPLSVTVHSNTTVKLDGKVVAKSVKAHTQKADKRRSSPRSGPFAGRN